MIDLPSAKIQGMISSPGFLCRMKTPVKVDFKHDVPYASGISQDGSTVYIDKSLKRYLKKKDIVQFLIVFEKARKALADLNPRITSQQAHYIATHFFELKAVEFAKISWDEYEKFLAPQLKTPAKSKNIPKDLDLTHFHPTESRFIKTKTIKDKTDGDKAVRERRLPKLRQSKAATDLK